MDLTAEEIGALRLAITRLERKLRKSVDVGDVTPSQLSALVALGRHGPFRVGELARREQVGNSTVTRLVATLEVKGLLVRSADADDARSSIVAITQRGQDVLDLLAGGANDYLRGRLEGLDPVDRGRIRDAIAALTKLAERT